MSNPTELTRADAHLLNESEDSHWIGPAETREDLIGAFQLVYANYLRCGYGCENETGMRVSPFNLLEDAVTFVSRRESHVVATVSIFPDGPFGLPADDVFADETNELREAGRRIAEVGMLADRRTSQLGRLGDLFGLFKLVHDYARLVLRATDLCITVNPHHVIFHERYLLFSQVGAVRPYHAVNGHPAAFLRVNLEAIKPERMRTAELRELFFGKRTPWPAPADRYRLTRDDIRFFLPSCPADGEGGGAVVKRYLEDIVGCDTKSPAGTSPDFGG